MLLFESEFFHTFLTPFPHLLHPDDLMASFISLNPNRCGKHFDRTPYSLQPQTFYPEKAVRGCNRSNRNAAYHKDFYQVRFIADGSFYFWWWCRLNRSAGILPALSRRAEPLPESVGVRHHPLL
jgi:hypothetical protein